MFRLRLKNFAISALIAATGASVLPAVARAADPIRIGLLLSITGPAAPFGIPERDAIEIIAKKINTEGGVNGRMIELKIYDDATNPTEAARGATQLIQNDKVVAIVGSTTGSGTLAAGPVAMRYQVPMLAPNGTIAVTAKSNQFYPWIFRTITNDIDNTKVMLERAIKGGAKKVGIFYQEDAYGKNTADYLQELAKKAGIEITGVAAGPMNSTDLTPQATRIRNAGPEVVLIQASAPAVGAAFVRAARQIGLTAPLWGPLGLGQKAFIDASGPAGDGVRLAIPVNWDDPAPELAQLGKLITSAGKTPSGFGELLGVNGLLAVVEAAKTIKGEISGKTLRDALERLCGLKTYTTSTACYSPENHDGWTGDILMTVEIRNGKFVTVK